MIALARQAGIAAVQVAHAGTAANVDEARKVLQGARRALYRILADDDTRRGGGRHPGRGPGGHRTSDLSILGLHQVRNE